LKIREINFVHGAFATQGIEHKARLIANDKLDMDLDARTASIRVNDRSYNGDGVYHVPLAVLRRWFPVVEDAKAGKK
jgi:hypothetical protein